MAKRFNLKKYMYFVLGLALLFAIRPKPVYANQVLNEGINEAIGNYKDEIGYVANIMIGFASVMSVLIFIIHFVRLGSYKAHSIMRKKVINDLMITAICTGLIGGFGLIFKIYLEIFIN